jgi:hypothetical protein
MRLGELAESNPEFAELFVQVLESDELLDALIGILLDNAKLKVGKI